jgi:hypothetical protein
MKHIHFLIISIILSSSYSQQAEFSCKKDSEGVCINPEIEAEFVFGFDSLMKTIRLIPIIEIKQRYNLDGSEFNIELIVSETGVAHINSVRSKKK